MLNLVSCNCGHVRIGEGNDDLPVKEEEKERPESVLSIELEVVVVTASDEIAEQDLLVPESDRSQSADLILESSNSTEHSTLLEPNRPKSIEIIQSSNTAAHETQPTPVARQPEDDQSERLTIEKSDTSKEEFSLIEYQEEPCVVVSPIPMDRSARSKSLPPLTINHTPLAAVNGAGPELEVANNEEKLIVSIIG